MSVRYTRSACVVLAHEASLQTLAIDEIGRICRKAEEVSVGNAVRETDVNDALKALHHSFMQERLDQAKNLAQRTEEDTV